MISNKELRNNIIINPYATSKVKNNQQKIKCSYCHFSNVNYFHEAIQVIMDQIEETIDHPKIKHMIYKRIIYLPKFQDDYFVFFTFFSSSDSGAPEQRVYHGEKIIGD